ncbi:carbohydrate-binding module family 48 protein [Neolentinus lepideus HHB14362 ss-1]|uniref:Carbohydrate-binding module family 48 protein n=1 Tax=Neolentinus lepideus HHB14362 ss-1 TaxID=1314782 RepID=A0A165UMJ7_9AGAM|nr:carbohydrate-binding module family 48 protein [Neolentinus lepideus HHB14362 ss-1]
MPDVLVQHPSTHIPVYPPNHRPKPGASPYYRASAPYSSTRSLASRASRIPSYQALPPHHEFVQETVYSTIPIALGKAEEERTQHLFDDDNDAPARRKKSLEARDPVPFRITWRGGGTDVVLIRAGDDNWLGRQPMDALPDGTFTAVVPLQRGTHHVRFIVDGTQRVADDLPSAVADDGTLANYVAVPISGLTPPASPVSFYSDHASQKDREEREREGADGDEAWTQEFPEALIAAAREEEAYLAVQSDPAYGHSHSQHTPAPNIPPAPVLPRFLDKLILNSRPGVGVGEARKEERRSRSRASLSLRSSSVGEKAIPVTTASGTSVTKGENKELALNGPGLADDASVLPVPSHVVLQHLSTSAIKNGVLAVGTTIRYKRKSLMRPPSPLQREMSHELIGAHVFRGLQYLTTIYYKPIS